jgi:hypothetical protein
VFGGIGLIVLDEGMGNADFGILPLLISFQEIAATIAKYWRGEDDNFWEGSLKNFHDQTIFLLWLI